MNSSVFLIGFLAPNGDFIDCYSYEHLALAIDIVNKIAPEKAKSFNNGLDYEKYLQTIGYIVVRSRDVYGLIGRIEDENGNRLHMTEAQIKWLNDNYEKFPRDKRESVDELFKWDGYNSGIRR